tara:strand:- start:184 stop:774 length:591 start_codon:yes stop_codon:yes gene_type:complete
MVTLSNDSTIISLFDHSGVWSKPYRDAGYDVIQIDLKHGQDIRWVYYIGKEVRGILMAPPCTAFAGSGAQYWKKKDEDGRTLEGIALIDAALRFVAIYNPVWWVLENPVGRLRRWLGPPSHMFNPCDYGDPYTKKTLLWGQFNIPQKSPVEPVMYKVGKTRSSWMWAKLGGKSERTKELRSMTPPGFAKAFFEANP